MALKYLLAGVLLMTGPCFERGTPPTNNAPSEPATAKPATNEPTTAKPTTDEPTTNEPASAQKIAVVPVKSVPTGMRGLLKGSLEQGFRWNDLNGENWLILTETGEFTPPGRKRKTDEPDEFRQAELYAYRFVNVNGVFSQAWQITDFVRECPLDITAEFIPTATEVTDLDGNGVAEAWVMYKTACRGDVSPATLKIIMYENVQKYAMRGRARIEIPDFAEGGDKEADPALRANPVFLQHAERKWNQFRKEKFE